MAKLIERFQQMWNRDEDDYEDDSYEEDEVDSYANKTSYEEPEYTAPVQKQKTGRVINMNQKSMYEVVVYRPKSFSNDTGDIAQSLLAKNAVVLNLEKCSPNESRRILDFLSGITFAQNGKISKVATDTYMITPNNITLSGDDMVDGFEESAAYM